MNPKTPVESPTSKNRLQNFLGHGWFKKQSLLFVAVSLLPLSLISFLSYQSTYDTLYQNSVTILGDSAFYQTREIQSFFVEMTNKLNNEARRDAPLNQFESLKNSLKISGLKPSEFIKTKEWQHEFNRFEQIFDYFLTTNEVSNLYLLDPAGNVLFSDEKGDDLGTNLFTGKYAKSLLSQDCRKAIEHGMPIFSDFQRYEPSRAVVSCFLITPLFNLQSNSITGLMAIELDSNRIDRVLNSGRIGHAGQAFLVGPDLLMRSNLKNTRESSILKTKVDTELTRHWQENYLNRVAAIQEKHHSHDYINHNGVEVLGISRTMDIGQTRMAVVTEMPVDEAFAAAKKQLRVTLLLFGTIAFAVLLVSMWAARLATKPLGRLTELADRIAIGDLDVLENKDSLRQDEFGLLARSFQKVALALRDVSTTCHEVALGIFNRTVVVRSEKDVLAQSVNTMVESFQHVVHQANSISKGEYLEVAPRSEQDTLGIALNTMAISLRQQDWLKSGITKLNNRMHGLQNLNELGHNILAFICGYLDVPVGAFFVMEDNRLRLSACHACKNTQPDANTFGLGEGLIGQVARDKKRRIFRDVPTDHCLLTIDSGIGISSPKNIVIIPLLHEGSVKGVIEFGNSRDFFSELELLFLEQVSEDIAITIHMAQSRETTQLLLEETQNQSEELQSQQEELKASNEELEQQSEELRVTNEELEEKSEFLEEQRIELHKAKEELEEKSRTVELASKYKSEFLANMSHELRSPLNSLLILARTLADNTEGNLTEDQVEAARIIHSGGHDLLTLINDILDLSKVEAGRLEIEAREVRLSSLVHDLTSQFKALATEKGLVFTIELTPEAPDVMITDDQRLKQILKNLLANAIKFTSQGSVTLKITSAPDEAGMADGEVISFSVMDTGIGIPIDKQQAIFEAFQQADGTTSRNFGGTGLGLTISRRLASLLGGKIQITSKEGEGSTFTLYLPAGGPSQSITKSVIMMGAEITPEIAGSFSPVLPKTPLSGPEQPVSFVPDDRQQTGMGDKSILIIEDDREFAKILIKMARQKGYKALAAGEGRIGIFMAQSFQPTAIILDLGLPDVDGEAVLESLKHDLSTRHIPVHVISAQSPSPVIRQKGALGYLAKPASLEALAEVFSQFDTFSIERPKHLLVIEDDPVVLKETIKLLTHPGANIATAATGKEALALLAEHPFDCVVLDLTLPDMNGFELLRELEQTQYLGKDVPVIIYTGRDMTTEENDLLQKYARTVVVKGAESQERLLDEVMLFLHSMASALPPEQQTIIRMIHDKDEVLRGKKILLVDDDMRNVFALSGVMTKIGMQVVMAANGEQALQKLQAEKGFDLVLMDIMMPVMDGYETMRKIREQVSFKNLPIIALTAKAMPEDRALCMTAGANDYIAKPVDQDKLFSLMRVWLCK